MDGTALLGLVLLGGWVAADTTAALQIMVSQPLVAAWLAGLVAGNPVAGLLAGIALQTVWGRTMALGGAGFPDAGPAAVVAGGLAARQSPDASGAPIPIPSASDLAVALGLAFLVAEAGRHLLLLLRRRRGYLVRWALAGAARGSPGLVVTANLAGALQHVLLGAGLTAVGLWAGLRLAPLAAPHLPGGGLWVLVPVLAAGLGIGAGGAAPRRVGLVWLLLLAAGTLFVGALQ